MTQNININQMFLYRFAGCANASIVKIVKPIAFVDERKLFYTSTACSTIKFVPFEGTSFESSW